MSYQQPGYPGTTPPSPYGAPKKDNTLMWVLGGIGAVILLCCCGVLGFFGWGALVAKDSYESISSDIEGTTVSEGGTAPIDDGTVLSGWSVIESSDGTQPIGVRVRNDDTYAKGFSFYVNFHKDGVEVDDSFCTTSTIQPNSTSVANCLSTIDSNFDYDEIIISEF